MKGSTSRDIILADVRAALGRMAPATVPPVPAAGRIPPRTAGDPAAEADLLLAQVEEVGDQTRRLSDARLAGPLAELVRAEDIHKAVCWPTPELRALEVEATLVGLGVEIVSPYADKEALAACDLGVTGADAALPETGTLILRGGGDRPRMVSLLPRVHLALVRPAALRADLGLALAENAPAAGEGARGPGYFVSVTGPSRTADIELTVTIGVHGPQALHVWLLPDGGADAASSASDITA